MPDGWTQGGEEITRESHPELFKMLDSVTRMIPVPPGFQWVLPEYKPSDSTPIK